MKKVKVSRKPKSSSEYTLKPNRLRMFLIYVVLFALAYSIGLIIRYALSGGTISGELIREDWLIDVLIVFGGPVLLAFLDYTRWVVKVYDEQLEGLSGAFGDRVVFPIKAIDWARSRKSLSSRLKIGNAIYADGRKRILISPWFYNPGEYQEFLSRIGLERAAQP